MLYKLLGCLWIVLGLLWLIRPAALRDRLKKKLNRKIRWIAYGFIAIFALSLIGSIIKAQGFFLKLIGIIGIIITIRAILLLTSKASERVLGKLAARPLWYFMVAGLLILAIGLILFNS